MDSRWSHMGLLALTQWRCSKCSGHGRSDPPSSPCLAARSGHLPPRRLPWLCKGATPKSPGLAPWPRERWGQKEVEEVEVEYQEQQEEWEEWEEKQEQQQEEREEEQEA